MHPERQFGEELLRVLHDAMEQDESQRTWAVTVYTSFGILRGHIRRATVEGDGMPVHSPQSADPVLLRAWSPAVIELEDAEVEHFYNHLSTASYRTLFVSVSDIRGFAFADPSRTSFV